MDYRNELSPGRLEGYLREPVVPYKAGYIAVRSVVSAWRETAGRLLPGTQIFNLLLHATQPGTFEAIRTPFECAGHHLAADASIGIALAPEHGTELDQILKNADLAMYDAKASGRRTYRFFAPEMDAQLRARRQLEVDLRQAIQANSRIAVRIKRANTIAWICARDVRSLMLRSSSADLRCAISRSCLAKSNCAPTSARLAEAASARP